MVNDHKQRALKRMLLVYRPNVILIQETTCLGPKSIIILSKIQNNWNFCSFDAKGLLGGLVTSLTLSINAVAAHIFMVGIILKGEENDLGEVLIIVNILWALWGKRAIIETNSGARIFGSH